MALAMLLLWTLVGVAAGWAAGYVMKEGGYGLIGEISLGAVGSLVGSGLYLYLGDANPGTVVSLVVASIGAAALIFALEHREGPSAFVEVARVHLEFKSLAPTPAADTRQVVLSKP